MIISKPYFHKYLFKTFKYAGMLNEYVAQLEEHWPPKFHGVSQGSWVRIPPYSLLQNN